MKNQKRKTVFAPDDARVIRYSELLRLYEIAGSVRVLATGLGISTSTIQRALVLAGGDPPVRDPTGERVEAVRRALEEAGE